MPISSEENIEQADERPLLIPARPSQQELTGSMQSLSLSVTNLNTIDESERPSSARSSSLPQQQNLQPQSATPSNASYYSSFEEGIEQGQYFDVVHERDPDRPIGRRIVVGLCHERHSIFALDYTLENLIHFGPDGEGGESCQDLIILMNVRPLPTVQGMSLWGPLLAYDDIIEQTEEKNIQRSLDLLRAGVAKVQARGINCEAISMRGDPREEIVQRVNDISPTLLVLGSNSIESLAGLVGSFLAKVIKPSITNSIVQLVRTSVLIAKASSL